MPAAVPGAGPVAFGAWAYTLPSASAGTAPTGPAIGPPSMSWPPSAAPSSPAVAADRAPAPPSVPQVGASAEYGVWARNQRPPGAVYGGPAGAGAGQLTTAPPVDSPAEQSGSFTGHILAHGRIDAPTSNARTTQVIAVLLIVVAALSAIGLLVAATAGEAVGRLFGALIGG
jgi:hypothetical protein